MLSLAFGTVLLLVLINPTLITAIDYEDNDLAKGNFLISISKTLMSCSEESSS